MATSTVFLCVLYTSALSLCAFCGYSLASTIVTTTYGPVNGSVISLSTHKTVITYLGIPFAKAERFEYPVPPDEWTTILQANKIDKICPQPNLRPNKLPLMSEQCLLLNVYVPANATSSSTLPVMLWIHGGAFSLGDTLGYDGSVLATEGNVVVVTAAYRLGVFGFLTSSRENLKGNYGMLDQIAAMKWVNKNIARFGGDPNKVTIFGGSAGGMCVALLMLSPLASGLYQNVIMQSGTAAAISSAKERNEADLLARSFAKAAGCEMTSLKSCVKTKSTQEVLDAQSQVFSNPILLPFGPVVDGYFLPDSPVKLLQAGKFNKSNIIVGVAREDGSIFITGVKGVLKGVNVSNGMPRPLFKEEIRKRTWLRYQDSQVLQLLVYEYTDWSNATDLFVLRQQFIDINSDATFKAPAIKSAKAFIKEGSPTYFYQLEMAPRVYPAIPFPTPPWLGVYHRADVFYTFGVPLVMAENLQTVAEVRLSKDIMTLWSNFAKTGNPNKPTPVTVTWPQYTTDQEEYIGLSANLTVRFKMRASKMALWNELLPRIEETIKPTASSHIPTTSATAEDGKDTIVMILAILTGVLAAAVVILLVVLIVKRKRRRRDFEQPLNM